MNGVKGVVVSPQYLTTAQIKTYLDILLGIEDVCETCNTFPGYVPVMNASVRFVCTIPSFTELYNTIQCIVLGKSIYIENYIVYPIMTKHSH